MKIFFTKSASFFAKGASLIVLLLEKLKSAKKFAVSAGKMREMN
jgi:hypothetical protein